MPPKEGSKAYKLRNGISINTHIVDISDTEKCDSQFNSLLSSTKNESSELVEASTCLKGVPLLSSVKDKCKVPSSKKKSDLKEAVTEFQLEYQNR